MINPNEQELLTKCPCCKEEEKCMIEKHESYEESRLCLSCGMTTQAAYKFESEAIKQVEINSPKIVNELRFTDDELKQYWYPSTIQIKNRGMIYPIGDKNNWKWAVAKVEMIALFERMNYPIPGKEGEYYETRLDVDNAQMFEKNEFLLACKELEMVKMEA